MPNFMGRQYFGQRRTFGQRRNFGQRRTFGQLRTFGLRRNFGQRPSLELSASAVRLLSRPKPSLRGRSHFWAAVLTAPVGIVLTLLAESLRAQISILVFALGVGAMFGVSAVVHGRDWSTKHVELLVRLDHSVIFLMFGTGATPVALLGLSPPVSIFLLVVAWGGAAIGIAAEWLPIHPRVGVMNGAYLSFGWCMIIFLPWLITSLAIVEIILLLGGGIAYTVGAIVVGARKPDPWPSTFGYHEIWHLHVVIAVLCHSGMVISLAF